MKIVYKVGDLMASTNSMAHCVSQDLKMGKGIAVLFKKKFGQVDELKTQCKIVGEVAVLQSGSQFIYYLITKKNYWDKPTYAKLHSTLICMHDHMVANGVSEISMPRIGCGLDRLKWDLVLKTLFTVFRKTNITITVHMISRDFLKINQLKWGEVQLNNHRIYKAGVENGIKWRSGDIIIMGLDVERWDWKSDAAPVDTSQKGKPFAHSPGITSKAIQYVANKLSGFQGLDKYIIVSQGVKKQLPLMAGIETPNGITKIIQVPTGPELIKEFNFRNNGKKSVAACLIHTTC